MRRINQVSIPRECFAPVIIGPGEGDFRVTLLAVEPFNGGFRWIYRIDNIGTDTALSDWVLGIDRECRTFIEECFTSGVFDSRRQQLPPLFPYNDCENEPNTRAPEPCENVLPPGSPCSNTERLVGFKFDELSGLVQGFSQLFAFTINQPPAFELGCIALKYGQNEMCGTICIPTCEDVPPGDCVCPEDENNFDCSIDFPSECFNLARGPVLSGFCIGDLGDPVSEPCVADATVIVCEQEFTCEVDVLRWTRTVEIDVQLNVPVMLECQEGPLYVCCFDSVTATQVCFTCADATEPNFIDPTCENTSILINPVTPTDTGAVVDYTIVLPPCETDIVG